MTEYTCKTAGELFDLRVRGLVARCYEVRRVEPDAKAWKFLRGEVDITVRDVSDIAYDLGFRFDFLTGELVQLAEPTGLED